MMNFWITFRVGGKDTTLYVTSHDGREAVKDVKARFRDAVIDTVKIDGDGIAVKHRG